MTPPPPGWSVYDSAAAMRPRDSASTECWRDLAGTMCWPDWAAPVAELNAIAPETEQLPLPRNCNQCHPYMGLLKRDSATGSPRPDLTGFSAFFRSQIEKGFDSSPYPVLSECPLGPLDFQPAVLAGR